MIKIGELRKKMPEKLKISPVAMIPHKSRDFRTILDLSFKLKINRTEMPSVNVDSSYSSTAFDERTRTSNRAYDSPNGCLTYR